METKTVYVVATYQAEVPKDMKLADIIEAVDRRFDNPSDCFGLSVNNYPDEENNYLLFERDDVSVGVGFQLAMEGERS